MASSPTTPDGLFIKIDKYTVNDIKELLKSISNDREVASYNKLKAEILLNKIN